MMAGAPFFLAHTKNENSYHHFITSSKMHKKLPFTLIVFCAVFCAIASWSYGRDSDGCLTCHQYPGLVRIEKGDRLKVLHIDEEKYAQSDHRSLACRQCHVEVTKVPHTDDTRVECNSKCHVSPKDKQMLETYDFKSLHSREQSYIRNSNDHSSCRVCHSLYPHHSNNLVRAFLNMHTGFMFCETCHINNKKFNKLDYEWISSSNIEFVGEPFGSYFEPHPDQAQQGKNVISRIAVYQTRKGKKESLINTQDVSNAQLFLKVQDKMEASIRKKELDDFHKDVAKKEVSVACNGCHAAKGIMDFEKLGFDEKKADHLVNINLKGLVDKYKIFFFPHLFPR